MQRKSLYRIFKLYQEDPIGHLLFHKKITRTLLALTKKYSEKHIRRQKEKQQGMLFKLDINKPYKRRIRRSFIGNLFIDRRKLRYFYGNLRDYQFRTIFYKAFICHGIFLLNLFKLLETRLDIILFRANFGKTLLFLRQLITHHGICVNKKIITKPNQLITSEDIITLNNNRIKYFIMNDLISRFNKIRNNHFLLKNKYVKTKFNIFYRLKFNINLHTRSIHIKKKWLKKVAFFSAIRKRIYKLISRLFKKNHKFLKYQYIYMPPKIRNYKKNKKRKRINKNILNYMKKIYVKKIYIRKAMFYLFSRKFILDRKPRKYKKRRSKYRYDDYNYKINKRII